MAPSEKSPIADPQQSSQKTIKLHATECHFTFSESHSVECGSAKCRGVQSSVQRQNMRNPALKTERNILPSLVIFFNLTQTSKTFTRY